MCYDFLIACLRLYLSISPKEALNVGIIFMIACYTGKFKYEALHLLELTPRFDVWSIVKPGKFA